jgi:hypothetical protein
MKRREFLAATGAAGVTAMAHPKQVSAAAPESRQYYELRQYQVDSESQRAGLDAYLSEALAPALNRAGIKPVGVFHPEEGLSPVYVLIPHPDLASVGTLTERLLADGEYLENGAAFLDAPADAPAFSRMTSSLLKAFSGMPAMETPVSTPGHLLQLRIYESPSVKTGQKKIEMFNVGEIQIFRDTGLHPVFFGEAIAGDKMPNLTYMLAFENQDERKANWQTFVNSDAWKEISSKPEYADDAILSNITNIFLTAAPYSQV